MKFLITGHKGLIGNEIYNRLINNNDVIGYDKDDIFPQDQYFDIIIHCASNCVVRDIIKNPKLSFDNIELTYKVMEYARINNIKRIILFSSSRVNAIEKNPYTVSKQYLENMAEGYYQCYNIEYIIIRPETVWSRNEKNKRVINIWIDNIINNKILVESL